MKTKKSKEETDAEALSLADYVALMRKSPQRHIRLIGEYADEVKPRFNTKGQWRVFTQRNLRVAKQLSPFTDDMISEAISDIYKDQKSTKNPKGFIGKWTLETLLKYILR